MLSDWLESSWRSHCLAGWLKSTSKARSEWARVNSICPQFSLWEVNMGPTLKARQKFDAVYSLHTYRMVHFKFTCFDSLPIAYFLLPELLMEWQTFIFWDAYIQVDLSECECKWMAWWWWWGGCSVHCHPSIHRAILDQINQNILGLGSVWMLLSFHAIFPFLERNRERALTIDSDGSGFAFISLGRFAYILTFPICHCHHSQANSNLNKDTQHFNMVSMQFSFSFLG